MRLENTPTQNKVCVLVNPPLPSSEIKGESSMSRKERKFMVELRSTYREQGGQTGEQSQEESVELHSLGKFGPFSLFDFHHSLEDVGTIDLLGLFIIMFQFFLVKCNMIKMECNRYRNKINIF